MPALIQREEITPPMQEALRRHIVRERERRKQEEKEAEKDFERRAKIEEERRRKEEEDSVTLEQIKEQLSSLHKKHENLKNEKHQLFAELKKVLHEESKRKQKLREQSELNVVSHYSHQMQNVGSYQMVPPGGHYQSHQMSVPFIPGHPSALAGQSSPHVHPTMRHSMSQPLGQPSSVPHQAVKRPLSPASPQPNVMQMYQRGGGASGGHSHLSGAPQHQKYDSSYGRSAPGHYSPLSSLSAASVNQAGGHSTPSRHITALHGSSSPSGRPSGQRSPYSMPLGKQLEHASKKSGFGEDSISSSTPPRGRTSLRMLPQGSLLPQQAPLSQMSPSTRVRSASPGKYQMNPEKSHSPFHPSAQLPGARYYKQ